MRIFFGLFFATLTNFVAGILGFYIATNFFYSSLNLDYLNNEISSSDYVSSFALKFFVILILTWIMHRVMAMLDTPKKRILFIFLLGSSFSLYNQVDVFWVEYSFTWSLISVLGESINWLLTGYVLSKFIKPKHLGAL
jgi:hypothetical protein